MKCKCGLREANESGMCGLCEDDNFKKLLVDNLLEAANCYSDNRGIRDSEEAVETYLDWIREQLPELEYDEDCGFSVKR